MSDETLAMYFNVVDHYGTPYWEACPVSIHETENGTTIQNLGAEHSLHDLFVYSFVLDPWTPGEPLHETGPYCEYRPTTVDLRQAEYMVKTLRKVQAGLSKAYETDGAPAHIGQYMLRVARILGIKTAVVRVDTKANTSWYTDQRFRLCSLASLSDTMAGSLARYIESGDKSAALKPAA